jgi:hypothetical protein
MDSWFVMSFPEGDDDEAARDVCPDADDELERNITCCCGILLFMDILFVPVAGG